MKTARSVLALDLAAAIAERQSARRQPESSRKVPTNDAGSLPQHCPLRGELRCDWAASRWAAGDWPCWPSPAWPADTRRARLVRAGRERRTIAGRRHTGCRIRLWERDGPILAALSPATASPAGVPARPTASAPGVARSSAPAPGPMLSSEPYASVAYRIWPGPVSSTASQALTGLAISVHQRAGGLAVTAAARGQGPATSHLYPRGVRVYVVEASMGDDSGNLDYSLGDDGLVVTDAQGRIIQ